MLLSIWLAALMVLFAGCSNPFEPLPRVPKIATAEEALSDFKWKRRLLVVSARARDNPDLKQQYANMMAGKSGYVKREYAERDITPILIVDGLDTTPIGIQSVKTQDLRDRLNLPADKFVLVLIGKDGGEKRRTDRPIDSADLFATIDAMPMRQQEMRRGE